MNAEPLSHDAAAELFSAYLDAELPEPELDRLEEHLDDCGECRSEYEEFAEALALVRGVPRLRAPRGFTRRVVKRAQRARKRGFAAAAGELVAYRVHAEIALAIVLAAALGLLIVAMVGG